MRFHICMYFSHRLASHYIKGIQAEMERTDALRNEGLEKLQGFLDESGGIARLSHAGWIPWSVYLRNRYAN